MVHIGKYLKGMTLATSLCLVSLSVPFYSAIAADEAKAPTKEAPAKEAPAKETSGALDGKKIAFNKKKGNCLACHMIAGGDMPGNIAPPLIGMKARFPDRAALHAQIADPMVKNPMTAMPPFGRHKILSDKELDAVVDFVHSL